NHSSRIPIVYDFVEPLVGGTPQSMPMTEGQVVAVSSVKDVGAVKERRAVLIGGVKAPRKVAPPVFHPSSLIPPFLLGIVQIKLHGMLTAIVERNESGVVVREVSVRAHEHVENIQIVERWQTCA